MITSIQISEELKNILTKYKKSSKDTYEDVIKNLIKEKEDSKQTKINLLKESYQEMHNTSKEINKEHENIDIEEMKTNEY